MQLTLGQSTKDKLKQLQDLLAHQICQLVPTPLRARERCRRATLPPSKMAPGPRDGSALAGVRSFYFVVCFVLGGVLGFVGQPELASFISWPVMIGYYVVFEGVFGATPGKLVTRTRVVGLDGGKPNLDRWSKTRVVRLAR